MSKLQVLVTTMHQKDFSKFKEMNLQTNAVIANQADDEWNLEEVIDNCNVKVVTTNTRGLSKNRNIALKNSFEDCDLIMFSDDDLVFHKGYEKIVSDEFSAHPEADAIKFNLNCISERKIAMKPISDFHKTKRLEVTSWGVCGLVIKRKSLLDKNLLFNENFGTGTENYCGEDTIFLQELFKKKIKLYASSKYIADIDQSETSWFEGHNQKFFYTSGKVIAEIFPITAKLITIRSAYKASKRKSCKLEFKEILRCYLNGINDYKKQ